MAASNQLVTFKNVHKRFTHAGMAARQTASGINSGSVTSSPARAWRQGNSLPQLIAEGSYNPHGQKCGPIGPLLPATESQTRQNPTPLKKTAIPQRIAVFFAPSECIRSVPHGRLVSFAWATWPAFHAGKLFYIGAAKDPHPTIWPAEARTRQLSSLR